MDTQRERNRLDEDSISDSGIDVNRSERREAVANQDDYPSREGGLAEGDGGSQTGSRPAADTTRDNAFSSGTGGDTNSETGSHQEGQYAHQSDNSTGRVGKPGDQPE